MTTQHSPITHRLKSDNWDLHQIAERGGTPESMIKGTMTREGFAEYLGQAIHVHRALDAAIKRAVDAMPALGELVDESQHFEQYFGQDLAYYNTDASESTPSAGTQRFVDHIEAHKDQPLHIFGLHYVRLGACNGNRFVARKLRSVFGIDHPTDGMMSQDPFGESQRTQWNTFKDGIDALDLDENQRDALFDGTRAAYLMTINMDLSEYQSAEALLASHGKSLDRQAFEQGHSVHVPAS
ncbi:MAG: biliverdin-producing heme oxygenase [Phycisphaerales bacterium]